MRAFNSWLGPAKGYLVGAALSTLLVTVDQTSRFMPFMSKAMAHEVTAKSANNASGESREGDMDAATVHLQSMGTFGSH